jgi:hypothetical protein
VEKRAFLNRKSGKMGVLSVNFILTPTVECGFEVVDFGAVYYGCTKINIWKSSFLKINETGFSYILYAFKKSFANR